MKKIFLIALIFSLGINVFAQLSTRENENPYVFKTGTRPEKGNIGIFLGPSITEVIDMIDEEINWRGMPLLNFKYYTSDRFVVRAGLQIYNTSFQLKGESTDDVTGDKAEIKLSESSTYFKFTPGFEYHFTPKNLCDVYVGANLAIGVKSNTAKAFETFNGEKFENNAVQNQCILGVGAFIGMQFFIADLPLAIGGELGFGLSSNLGLQTKHVESQPNAEGKAETQTYYTYDYQGVALQADKMSVRKMDVGADFRITFSYFFCK